MAHENNHYVAMVVPLTTLAVADEIDVIRVPADAAIIGLSGSLRTLVSGTQTVTLKNDGGTTLGSVSWTSAGTSNGTINSAAISANNNIHVNITSLGVSVVDCSVTIWMKIGSIT